VIRRAFSGPRRWIAWTCAAAPLYAVSCVVAEGGLATVRPWGDVGQYERYGRLVLDGAIPYHDFYLEYPPGALPSFIAPALVTEGHSLYLWLFKLLMAFCGLAALTLTARTLVVLHADSKRLAFALAAFTVAPLTLGHIFLNRYDAWPGLLTVLALSTLLSQRALVAAGTLALDFAAKVFAVTLAPVVAIRIWRTNGTRRLRDAVVSFAAVSVFIFSPFLVVAFGGLGNSYYTQLKRALQIESIGASLLLVADQLGIHHVAVTTNSPGSIDLGGQLPSAIGALTTLAQIAAIVLVAFLYWRGPETQERLVTAFTASVAAFALFGKVLSPQFLIWLVPLVPLVSGKKGRLGTSALLVALVLTQIEQHGFIGLGIKDWAVWLLFTRNAILVAMFGLLVSELRPAREVR
jgi:hypothetical protein